MLQHVGWDLKQLENIDVHIISVKIKTDIQKFNTELICRKTAG